MLVINLEAGMPLVEKARLKLDTAIRSAKRQQIGCMKIIHGYGSSGRGGAIKKDVIIQLRKYKNSGIIKKFVIGENASVFDEDARFILEKCVEFGRDKDFGKQNHGVTFVLL